MIIYTLGFDSDIGGLHIVQVSCRIEIIQIQCIQEENNKPQIIQKTFVGLPPGIKV